MPSMPGFMRRQRSLDEPGQDLARAEFDVLLDTERVEREHRFAPADRAQQVLGQLALRIGERRDAAVRVDGDRRLAELGARECGLQALGGRRHQRRVEGAADVEAAARARRSRLSRAPRPARARGIAPARTTWPGELSFATIRVEARRRASAIASGSPFRRTVMPLGVSAAASAIALARSSTSASAGSKSTAPAATSAAYSPSEWPAATIARRAAQAATARPSRGKPPAAGSGCPRRGARTGRSRAGRARRRTPACRGAPPPCRRCGFPDRGR